MACSFIILLAINQLYLTWLLYLQTDNVQNLKILICKFNMLNQNIRKYAMTTTAWKNLAQRSIITIDWQYWLWSFKIVDTKLGRFLPNVRFISYSKCSNWRPISKLLSNFGCLSTFCYSDGLNSIETDLLILNLWTGQFVSYKSVI